MTSIYKKTKANEPSLCSEATDNEPRNHDTRGKSLRRHRPGGGCLKETYCEIQWLVLFAQSQMKKIEDDARVCSVGKYEAGDE